MTNEEKEYLKKALNDSFALKQNFADFEAQTRIQLLLSQLQFSLSLSSISLALVGIGLGTGKIELSMWTISTGVTAFILLIYSSTLYRELIDIESDHLVETGEWIKIEHEKIVEKIISAFEASDPKIFTDYAEKRTSEYKKDLILNDLQIGEILVFLFILTLSFAILTALKIETNLLHNLIYYLIITLFAYLLSFRSWTYKLTIILSQRIKGANQN